MKKKKLKKMLEQSRAQNARGVEVINRLCQEPYRREILRRQNPDQARKDFELAAKQRDDTAAMLRACELENNRLKEEIEALKLELKGR